MKPTSRLRAAFERLFWLPEYLYRLPPEHPHRFFAAQVILYVGVGVILLVAVLRAHGGDLPPHGVAVDRYGTWACERGYLMRQRAGGFECVAEQEAAREPRFEVSGVPSAGEGARGGGGEGIGSARVSGAAAVTPEAQGAGTPPLVIQTDRAWTVLLDNRGNPSTVIIGEPESRPAPSAPFGR
jgi:hypothetical protein